MYKRIAALLQAILDGSSAYEQKIELLALIEQSIRIEEQKRAQNDEGND